MHLLLRVYHVHVQCYVVFLSMLVCWLSSDLGLAMGWQ